MRALWGADPGGRPFAWERLNAYGWGTGAVGPGGVAVRDGGDQRVRGAVLARANQDAADAIVKWGRKLLQRIFGVTAENQDAPEAVADLAAAHGRAPTALYTRPMGVRTSCQNGSPRSYGPPGKDARRAA
ncbi:hypothetical protein Hesp01_47050 [Herbidospora sp. NBRC 101105]|nr:hypothetical protein Hesp01_47050 [Herbidospora sp. NBRC 101105]